MEKEKTTTFESVGILILIMVILFPFGRFLYEDIQEERNRDVTRACINGAFADGDLSEELSFVYHSGDETTAEEVSQALERTNQELNQISKYLNCIHTDLLNNR